MDSESCFIMFLSSTKHKDFFFKVFEDVSKMSRAVHSFMGGDLRRGCGLEFAEVGVLESARVLSSSSW